MKTKYSLLVILSSILFVACNDFLEKPPITTIEESEYWTKEEDVETFSWGFYTYCFPGYATSWTFLNNRILTSQMIINDDLSQSGPKTFIKNIPSSTAGWNNQYTYIRKANIMLEKLQSVPMSDDDKAHWIGVARFFRAFLHAQLVERYGDIPWINKVPTAKDYDLLYQPRMDRKQVMDSVLADYKFACENVKEVGSRKGLIVNKDVVYAIMSRQFLFEGTWQKYHFANTSSSNKYLDEAMQAAKFIIDGNRYSLESDYHKICASPDLASNKEMILYRAYETNLTSHSAVSANNKEIQYSGASKSFIDSYLCTDGLPIGVSSLYQGDSTNSKFGISRDKRMFNTLDSIYRLEGYYSNFASTGYAFIKHLDYSAQNSIEGTGILNITDAPIIRLGEVLLNYAEAKAEMGNISQLDLDITINLLRDRGEVSHLQYNGGAISANGVNYEDPDRDISVSPIIWEIRRERRIELIDEDFRYNDLRRWKKLDYCDQIKNPNANRGVYINKSDYPGLVSGINLTEGDRGYIITSSKPRELIDEKVYLDPIGTNEIKLYETHGYVLTQNPGW